jgi:predicted Zn-ribbon and HTH transcriptional regulator
MISLLCKQEMSARELSQAIGIREKEVYTHLSHIERSVAARKKNFMIIPSRCMNCGFVFKNRKRFTRPGRCPHCKSEYILNPMYQIK